MNHPTGRTSLAADVWMTTEEAAAYTRRHVVTIRKAAGSGELQSVQRSPGGPRRHRREWLDAWLTGTPLAHAT